MPPPWNTFAFATISRQEPIAIGGRLAAPALHALAGLLPFRGRRIAFGVECLLCRLGLDDQAAQVVGRLSRDEHEDDRAVGARTARGVDTSASRRQTSRPESRSARWRRRVPACLPRD